MKKKFYLFAVSAAMLLTACSSEEIANDVGKTTKEAAPMAVGFDTYMSNATRHGVKGVMTTDKLKTANQGFGVFACQQEDGKNYSDYLSPVTNVISNFMWNEHVHYSESAWTYSPLKYWPNETTQDSQTTDGAATSTHTDRLSFFAYAPYVTATAATGEVTATSTKDGDGTTEIGITALTANDAKTDPMVTYKMAKYPSHSVDLLWGVAPTGGLSYTSVNPSTSINKTQYLPLTDLIKPAKDQKIKFLFNHALARLGLTVVAAADQISPGGSINASETKIVIESVAITDVTSTTANRITMDGVLNLNSTSATTNAAQSRWHSRSNDLNITIDATHELNDELKAVFKSSVLNKASSFAKAGVTTTEKQLIQETAGTPKIKNYFMVIPSHADVTLQVVITYYVLTNDEKVNGNYAVTKNVITKKKTIPNFTNNKAYNLKLILGMTSVKFDAEVADWQDAGATEIYVPINNE